ncbi:MAG: Cache sensor-containing methyl-accepting chemotaxis sensory transducer, partial [Promethearchaeota archaeon CR_4]
VDSIATVAEETSASTEEASASAEEQASSMEEITATSQTLAELASNLKKLIDQSEVGGVSSKPEKSGKSPKSGASEKIPPPESKKGVKDKKVREVPTTMEEIHVSAPDESKSAF